MLITRRKFVALGSAAAMVGGCRCTCGHDGADVRFGVISDTHATGRESVPELVRAFSFLRDRGVDAVVHCGDLTDLGYIHQLEAFAEAWRQAMPDDIPLIPVLGNRDLSDTLRMSDATRTSDFERLVLSNPAGHVRRILGVDIGDGNRVQFIRGMPVIASDWKHESNLEAFMLERPELRDPSRPFVYVQHSHPERTVGDYLLPSADPVTCWLNMFPRAVSVSGHSHLPFTDKRIFCCREFTAFGAGSHYLGGGPQQTGRREVAVLTIGRNGVHMERFDLHSGFHDVLSRDFPAPAIEDVRTPGSFLFAQWNVGGFCLGQDGAKGGATASRAEAFRRQVAALDADFIGLCEYAPDFGMGGTPASTAAFDGYVHAAVGPRLGANGNALLSRHVPFSEMRIHHFANRSQKRYCTMCEAVVGGAKTVLAQTHLDLDETNRRTQLAELLRLFGDCPRVILSGDFNEAKVEEFSPFKRAGFTMANDGRLFTHRRRNTVYTPAIDNVLVKGFEVLSARTADDSMLLSDHRILLCRMRALK